jgi:hypothetical protein
MTGTMTGALSVTGVAVTGSAVSHGLHHTTRTAAAAAAAAVPQLSAGCEVVWILTKDALEAARHVLSKSLLEQREQVRKDVANR